MSRQPLAERELSKIIHRMHRNGISQRRLASLMGVTQRRISMLVNDAGPGTRCNTIDRLNDALDRACQYRLRDIRAERKRKRCKDEAERS